MADGVREFFNKPAGKAIAGGAIVVAAIAVFMAIKGAFGPSEAGAISRDQWFVDAETGKPFRHQLEIGDVTPVKAPSGKNTGYQAELCYWTKDGKPKEDPTPVLMNTYAGKPEPTFCPDCGRLVVMLNPPASTTGKPPPTEEEYKAKKMQPRE